METAADSGLWGEFEYGVDEKGRLVIPPDFRAALGKEFVVARAPERGIYVFPMGVWSGIEEQLRGPALERGKAYLRQMMGGSRTVVKLDSQYRLSIPRHLREWAQINESESAVIVGQGHDNLEIWSKTNWNKRISSFTYESMYSAVEAAGLSDIMPR